MKIGITNLKPTVALAVELGNVADVMGRTKGVAKFMALSSLMDEAIAAGSIDFKQVKEEIKDLDASEIAELHSFIGAKFDIKSDKLEATIEGALGIAIDLFELVEKAIALSKAAKA
jgi:hypothetical protein